MDEPMYNDDVKMIADLLSDNWQYDFNERPFIYYDQNAYARRNVPGSIYIYSLGRNSTRVGINYEMARRTHRLTIDIQNPQNRELHYKWMNEVYRILMKFRRAGKEQLGGWDYIDMPNDGFRQGYVAYYHDTMDITLVREAYVAESSGFGNIEDSISGLNDYYGE